MNSEIKLIAVGALALLLATAAIVYGMPDYDSITEKECQKWSTVPESQVDRLPDGCIPYYYEGR